MGAWKKVLVHVACSGLFFSGFTGAVLPVAAQQDGIQREQSAANGNQPTPALVADAGEQAKVSELPDSPGATLSRSGEPVQPQSTTEQRWGATPSAPQSAQSQPPEIQAQPAPQKPVGTAAAESPNATGVAASQPAGAAIAPAKQRRVRTIVLRMGAIVGAGVAVGSVVALTQATPSKPPGAH